MRYRYLTSCAPPNDNKLVFGNGDTGSTRYTHTKKVFSYLILNTEGKEGDLEKETEQGSKNE